MENLYACLSPSDQALSDYPHLQTPLTPELPLTGSTVATAGKIACAIRGWMHYQGMTGCSTDIAARLAADFAEKGVGMLQELSGSFALIIVDRDNRQLVAAVDRMAQQPLSYAQHGEFVFVGTTAGSVARSGADAATVNPQALHDFMLSHMVSAPDTVFNGTRKLLHGEVLIADRRGLRLERYWQPDFQAERDRPVAESRDAVLDTLQQAIEREGPGKTSGSFLSGGLDSSTVTGLLARSQGDNMPAFSVGFGVEEFDELKYARIAAKHFKCQHEEYNVNADDIVDLIPKIAAAYDEPFGNSSAIPTFCCARLAKSHGIDHLYAGDGGDELFGGNERYVRQRVFDHYWKLPAFVRKGLIEPIAGRFDPDEGFKPIQKFASYVRQAKVPLPDRFESWNLIFREGTQNVFDHDFLTTIDTDYPMQKMRDVWASCPSEDPLDKMLWYDWKFTLADSDLPKVSTMCELAGVRVSYPMLDDPFVTLSQSVPTDEKIRGGELRSFFRDAVKDFLPAETLTKDKHGFGLPFGVWLKTHDRLKSFVYGSLDTLANRGILSTAFLERVAEEHKSGHAGYYGYAIWDLIMLEQWFRAHIDGQAA
ncbi:MAG: asparagine synthetase B [Woeseiaceae bacterium]